MSEVSEFITKVSPSYETETMEEAIALVEHCKNFRIMRIKSALQVV